MADDLINDNLLEVDGLKVHFPITAGLWKRTVGHVRAVDDVSFKLKTGETLALVGESGCGKTTTGRAIMRAVEPTDGEILFKDKNDVVSDVVGMSSDQLKDIRQEMQMIFQDPFASLNPRMTIFDLVADPLKVNGLDGSSSELEARVSEMLQLVGLSTEYMRRYPHAFSGGQRQRLGIARSLVMNPRLLVADEPVSALDVSVQLQVINLLKKIQKKYSLSYIFISHDIALIKSVSDKIIIMKDGIIVESGKTKNLFSKPNEDYTKELIVSSNLK